jgi:hypothetical protein
MKHEIKKNFLPKIEFNNLKDLLMSNNFPWFRADTINYNQKDKDKTCYFYHNVHHELIPSTFFGHFVPLLSQIKMKSLIRMKANCYPSSKELITHEAHKDFQFEHKGAIFYINSNDGFTVLEDETKIPSIENTLLLFDSSKNHSSTTCTNDKARINININYF